MKRIQVVVSNDLVFDQRVAKTCESLQQSGFEVSLWGISKSDSKPLERGYRTTRQSVFFKKGALFYAALNLRLFCYLLFARYDIIWANDLDTLWPAVLAKRLRSKQLIYDSHEYFTEAEGLTGRDSIKRIWERIERRCIPHVDVFLTVNESIAAIYREKYNREVLVQRNMPVLELGEGVNTRAVGEGVNTRAVGEDRYIILQGAYIDPDRGGMELVEAFQYVESVRLKIVGAGRDLPRMKQRAEALGLLNKIEFIDRLPYQELRVLTKGALLGVSLDKPMHLNYTLSLPNKIFDYIHAGVPVLVSPLVELQRVVAQYQVGVVVDEVTPLAIAQAIESAVSSESYPAWKANCSVAARTLNWENDFQKIRAAIATLK